jgi:hypothetical protein
MADGPATVVTILCDGGGRYLSEPFWGGSDSPDAECRDREHGRAAYPESAGAPLDRGNGAVRVPDRVIEN